MNMKEMFDYLVGLGFTPEGTAGLMGNLKAESNLSSTNLQNSFERSLGMTDKAYTLAVDEGKHDFVHDSAGYGLAQWTFWSRKQKLLDFAKAKGVSIGDCKMQMEFLYKELQGYKKVFDVLKTTNSIQEASDVVLLEFERPADQSDKVKQRRAKYGQDIYAVCANLQADKEIAAEKKSVEEIAKEVIAGKWGAGDERKTKLKAAGYNYTTVQKKVNEFLKKETTPVMTAEYYVVRKKDTLSGIAKQYGTTYLAIAKLNGLANPNRIFVGQKLRVK